MSKQLALSSAFAVFAMAAMTLGLTPDRGIRGPGETLMSVQVQSTDFDLHLSPVLN